MPHVANVGDADPTEEGKLGHTLPETNIFAIFAPENGWVSNRNLLFHRSIFRFCVSFREGNCDEFLAMTVFSLDSGTLRNRCPGPRSTVGPWLRLVEI